MGLIYRIVDPPLISLVDIHHHKASCHIHSVIVRFLSASGVDKWILFPSIRHKLRLISAELDFMFFSVSVRKPHDRLLKLPGIQTELIFMDIREPDSLHLRLQEFPGIKFRLRSRCAVAKDRIALKFLHLLCEAVGISDIHCL